MQYLLIDFGASFIKTIIYDTTSDIYIDSNIIESPLKSQSIILKEEILNLLKSIVDIYPNIDKTIICSILGGKYIGDVYYSWKADIDGVKNQNSCIIKDLFLSEKNKLSHMDICDILIDTDCVIRAAKLVSGKNTLINMGTGSQVIYIDESNTLQKFQYIPSGRALNVFGNFFNELGIDFWYSLSKLTLEDILNSNLEIDLNIFQQSHLYHNGGLIAKIQENNFTVKNFISSILRCYLEQYNRFLISTNSQQILLAGGIPKKIKAVKDYFKYKLDTSVELISDNIEETLIGLALFAKDIKVKT